MSLETPLTADERWALCQHHDPLIASYLTAIENGDVGQMYDTGRGSGLEPRSDGTLVSYSGTLNKLSEHLNGTPLVDATTANLQAFIDRDTRHGTTRRGNTSRQNRSAVRGLYRWIVYEGHLTARNNPARLLRAPDADPEVREPVADHVWLQVVHSSVDPDNRIALGLGYYCGLRRSEIATLTPGQVDPLHQRITFLKRKGGKTKSGLEYGQLVGVLCDHRPEVADGAQDWVSMMEFYAKYNHAEPFLIPAQAVKYPGQRLADQLEHHVLPGAGLPKGAFTYHQLRHSFGTNMALSGLDDRIIADQMSHSDTSTTAGYINAAGQIAAWRKRETSASPAARAWHDGVRGVK